MTSYLSRDEQYMAVALQEAEKALASDEVPVGAVIVYQDRIIARHHNQILHTLDPTAHAEILVLREAACYFKNYRLPEVELFVTLEPCAMCMGTLLQSRVKRLIFASFEGKTGCCGSVCDLSLSPLLNHHTRISTGILIKESQQLLQRFFQHKRS